MYYVYFIPHPNHETNLEEGYIGVTNNLSKRFHAHAVGNKIVGKGIRKYSLTMTNVKILYSFDNEKDAYSKEKDLRPREMMGWNIAPGGLGGSRGPMSEEGKIKRRNAVLGEKNPFFNKKHGEDTRKHISSKLHEKPKEWRRQNSANAGRANKNKVRTEEAKKNYSNAANQRPKFTCPYCNKVGQYNSMIRYHGENCKLKLLPDVTTGDMATMHSSEVEALIDAIKTAITRDQADPLQPR